MLVGRLRYRDEEFGELEYKVTAVEDYNSLKLLLHNTIYTSEQSITAKNLLDREILKGTKEVSYRYSKVSSNTRRIDLSKGGSARTNVVNREFVARTIAAINYMLEQKPVKTEQEKLFEFTNNEPTIDDLLQRSQKTVEVPDKGYVSYDKGLLTAFSFSGVYVDLFLEQVDDDGLLVGQFAKLKQKDNWDNLLSTTPIIQVTAKYVPEILGFTYVNSLIGEPPRLYGIYQNMQEVEQAHPDKNTAWLKGRKYIVVDDSILEEVINDFLAYDGYIVYDAETTGLRITYRTPYGQDHQVVGVVLSKEIGTGYYFPMQHKAFQNVCNGDHAYFMRRYMRKILETKKIVCHNVSFDWKTAYAYGIIMNCVFDTIVALQCTERYKDSTFKTGLKSVTKMIFDYDMLEINDFIAGDGTLNNTDITFADLPYELVRLYACTDGDTTLMLLSWILETQLLERFKAERIFKEEVVFSMAVAYSEYMGYRINMEQVPRMKSHTEKRMEELTAEMHAMAGEEFSPSSPKQIAEVFYDKLGIPTKGTDRTTGADYLKEIVENYRTLDDEPQYPIVKKLLDYRVEESLFKNFFKKLHTFISDDATIHPKVRQFGTDTGRASVSEPNYQSYNDVIKGNVVARLGYYMFDCDFSQIEYRVLASIAQEQKLLDEFQDPDMDYHTYQASRMFNVPYAAVPKELRSQSKGINFGLPYGMGDSSLGARIFGTRNKENTLKAAALRIKFFEGQEKILAFFERVRQEGVDNGFTSTDFGRNRFYDKSKFEDGQIKRQAGNHVIQGTAADIYKMAVNRMFLRIVKEGWLGLVLLNAFVHDELVMEVHKSIDPYYFFKAWREEFQLEIEGYCPLFAGAGVGFSWYEAKAQDLPVGFIQEVIDQYDPQREWNEDYASFIKWTNDSYYDYKHRRIAEALTDPELDHHVIKPIINGLLNEMVLNHVNALTLGNDENAVLDLNYKHGTTFRHGEKYKEKAISKISFYTILEMYKEAYNAEQTIQIYAPDDADKALEYANGTVAVKEVMVTEELTNFDIIDYVLYRGYHIDDEANILFLTEMPITVGGQPSTIITYFNQCQYFKQSGTYRIAVANIDTKEVLLYDIYTSGTEINQIMNTYSSVKGFTGARW